MEILKARLTIESRIAAEATQLVDASNLHTLAQILQEMQSATEPVWYDNLDRAFHITIAMIAQQPAVADLLAGLIDRMRWRTTESQKPRDVSGDLSDHKNILEALRSRSVQAAVSAMRSHLLRIRERMFEERWLSSSYGSKEDSPGRECLQGRDGALLQVHAAETREHMPKLPVLG